MKLLEKLQKSPMGGEMHSHHGFAPGVHRALGEPGGRQGVEQGHARPHHHSDFLIGQTLSFLTLISSLSGLKSTWKPPGVRKMERTPHESHSLPHMETLQAPNGCRQQRPHLEDDLSQQCA